MSNRNRDKGNKQNFIFTRETMGMTLLLFSVVVLLLTFSGQALSSGIVGAVCTFMYGSFGYGSYLLMALTAYLGFWLAFNKRIKLNWKLSFSIASTVIVAFLLFHAAMTRNISLESYGGYISNCYTNAANGYSGYTFGGVVSAIFVYPVAKLTTFTGAYIIYSLLTVAGAYLIYYVARRGKKSGKIFSTVKKDKKSSRGNREDNMTPVAEEKHPVHEYEETEGQLEYAYTEQTQQYAQPEPKPAEKEDRHSRKILFKKGEFDAESYRRNLIFNEDSYFNHPIRDDKGYLNSFSNGKKAEEKSYSESYQDDVLNSPVQSSPTNYVYGDKPVESLDDYEQTAGEVYTAPAQPEYNQPELKQNDIDYGEILKEQADSIAENQNDNESEIEYFMPEEKQEDVPVRERVVERFESIRETPVREDLSVSEEIKQEEPAREDEDKIDLYSLFGSSSQRTENRVEPDTSRLTELRRERRSNADLFDYEDDDEEEPVNDNPFGFGIPSERRGDAPISRGLERANEAIRSKSSERKPEPEPKAEEDQKEEKPKHIWKKYVHPTLDLLDDYPENNNVNTGEIEENKRIIVETLGRFKINSEVSNVTIGPAITRYDVIIEDKTKIKQSLNYREAVAMALKKENVNAYLNYSKGALSIEIPNNERAIVGLKGMLASQKFINSKAGSLTFGLGKNVEGEVVCPDITKMPHLLVAGTTGSGKSICLSALLISLLYKYGPEDLRLILVDPKQVEFISYDKLPHLMINEILYEVDKAIKALNWAIKEMERRYSLFKEMTEHGKATKNLDEYNANISQDEEKLPKIVIILDEFGDLMIQAKKDIESRIIKLVQKARACGIHLILATQRPSVDCITGLIKSNLPTRIGFKVNSFDDARTIFDIGGAEKLLGKGDLYFRSAENPDLSRIQGCFIGSSEVQRVTDFVKANNETYFDQDVSDFINKVEVEESAASSGDADSSADGDAKIDETFINALKYCVTSNQASVSMIQRRFPVGYIKACKIIDWMENMNYITPSEGSKPRKVLLTKDEFLNIYGDVDD